MRSGAKRYLIVAVVGALMGPLAAPAGALTLETVLATKADEWNPAASADYFAWDVWTGEENVAYAKRFGGKTFQVSADGWGGNVGGISGTKLAYQQYRHGDKSASDIYLFDLAARTRMRVGDPVSTSAWEYDAGISGNLIAFARWYPSEDRKLFVFDRSTKKITRIASTSGKQRSLWLGQISGNYVAYEIQTATKTDLTSCNVYRYDIATRDTVKIPNPGPKCQYAPSVDSNGTVYYGRSGFGCGLNVSLQAYPVGGPSQELVGLGDDRDFISSYASEEEDGSVHVYLDVFVCGKRADIKRVTLPAPT
jgi:hypothetical protein